MYTYEVTIIAPHEVAERFLRYLIDEHISDILATGCFESACLESEADGVRSRVRYLAADRAAIDEYLEYHAARLRSDAAGRFPEGISIERSIWSSSAEFPAHGSE